MGSIPKIVSTPLKWVSKQVLNRTLLRFPGGDTHSPIACVYCPEMCRFSCPTAVVSGNDAVTPCNKMGLLYQEKTWPGQKSQGQQLWPIYDCTGCGRCTEYCVYEMPVMEQLFEARKKNPWDFAKKIAASLTDQDDWVGDLADELGDAVNAERRLTEALSRDPNGKLDGQPVEVTEPKQVYFLQKKGHEGQLSWESFFTDPLAPSVLKKLANTQWLLHESVWFTRFLQRSDDLHAWIKMARASGVEIKRPFAQDHDCIDCGGEGIYSKTFPSQARQMAIEIWERDRDRVDGILCVSRRCAEHFRAALGGLPGKPVPVVSFEELSEESIEEFTEKFGDELAENAVGRSTSEE